MLQVQSPAISTRSGAAMNPFTTPSEVPVVAVLGTNVRFSKKVAKAAPEVVKLNRCRIRELLIGEGDRIVSIDYVKLDGKLRTLTGRRKVTAFLKGGENKVESVERPYLTMFDIQLQEYRTVNLSTVTSIRASRVIYQITD